MAHLKNVCVMLILSITLHSCDGFSIFSSEESVEVGEEETHIVEEKTAQRELQFIARRKGNLILIKLTPPADGELPIYEMTEFEPHLAIDGNKLLTDSDLLNAKGVKVVPRINKDSKAIPEKVEEEPIQVIQYFHKDLFLKMKSPEVLKLQRVLNTAGYRVSSEGNGSPGNETEYFGSKTSKALNLFKRTNKNGIEPFGGFDSSGDVFDSATRQYLNMIISEDNNLQLAFEQ